MDNMIDIKDFKADLSDIKIENLLDLSKTDAAPLFEGKTYPFEILPEIKGYITDVLIPSLDKAEFEQRGENVFVAKNITICEIARAASSTRSRIPPLPVIKILIAM